MRKSLAITVLCSLLPIFLSAESIEDKLQSMGESYAKGYITPFVTAMGIHLNTGLYGTAKTLKPLRFGLTLNSGFVFVPSDGKTFTANSPDLGVPGESWTPESTESATCWGKNGATFVESTTGTTYTLPKGAELSTVPMMMPQFQLGLPYGNEVTLRYLPKLDVSKDVGEVGFWGVGLKHDIDRHIPLCPVSLAVQGVYQKFELGDILDIDDWAVNAEVSKTFLFVTPYAGVQYENTKMHVEYDINATQPEMFGPDKVKFDVTGDNQLRGTVGVRFRTLIFNLNLDYSICEYPVFNLGFGVSI
jgi:hypothetical protein